MIVCGGIDDATKHSHPSLFIKCATFLLLVNGIDTSLLNLDLKAAIQKSMPSLKRFNEDEEVKRAVVALEALALPVSSSSR